MEDETILTDNDAVEVLHAGLARDMLGRTEANETDTVTIGTGETRETLTLYASRHHETAFVFSESNTWGEAFHGHVTDVVEAYEARVREAVNNNWQVTYEPADDSLTDFSDVEFDE